MSVKYPKELLSIMAHLKKLPGVGSKTAERFAFQLLKWPKEDLNLFGESLQKLKEELIFCEICGCFKVESKCPFCDLAKRDRTLLCLIGSPKDVLALEETKSYFGLYHVLDRLISPYDLHTYTPNQFDRLKKRLESGCIKEIIIALDSTIEGETTSLILKRELQKISGLKISRLASGVPLGSLLEYVDGGTLTKSILGRQSF
jgi:recombination protein RecR